MPQKQTAVICVRVSTEDQATEGVSVEAQSWIRHQARFSNMVPHNNSEHPEPRSVSDLTDEELLDIVANALNKPAEPSKESAAEHLERLEESDSQVDHLELKP